MTSSNVYETLYNNMKNAFTVVNNDTEYTLGEYMLMKTREDKVQNTSNLPATTDMYGAKGAIVGFFSYVNEKLTVKKAPVKDKTIRAFPFRTCAAALLSAVMVCSLIVSFGTSAIKTTARSEAPSVIATESDYSELENDAFRIN